MAGAIRIADSAEQRELPLDRARGFDLLEGLFGSLHDVYARSGGVDAILREMHGDAAADDPQ